MEAPFFSGNWLFISRVIVLCKLAGSQISIHGQITYIKEKAVFDYILR